MSQGDDSSTLWTKLALSWLTTIFYVYFKSQAMHILFQLLGPCPKPPLVVCREDKAGLSKAGQDLQQDGAAFYNRYSPGRARAVTAVSLGAAVIGFVRMSQVSCYMVGPEPLNRN